MRFLTYLNERLGFTGRHRRVLDKPVPGWINYFYCFGGITFTLFLVLVLTGLLLSMQYSPSENEAYRSIQQIQLGVPLGRLLRGAHYWAGNLMVVTIVLHMLRVFITGAYKSPRELHWVAGSFLLLLTLSFGFTGYLLPWDQKAYWATVIGTNMLGSVPLAGPALAGLLRGGSEVTGQTLLRFYSMHILWLPAFTVLFLWLHFHMIRRTGISGGL
jgi:quinol-cytochrome oxidoreductase complex cytochrome b subunit